MKNRASYEKAAALFPGDFREALLAAASVYGGAVRELRVYDGLPVLLLTGEGLLCLSAGGLLTSFSRGAGLTADVGVMRRILLNAAGATVFQYEKELSEGYITVRGGIRIGICCARADEGISLDRLTSVNIRIPYAEEFACPFPARLLREGGLLVAGVPGSGKTTVLKACCRELCSVALGDIRRVSVIDARGELESFPENGKKYAADIIACADKARGIQRALRLMSPEYVVLDEIGGLEETERMLEGMNSGVRFVSAMHAGNIKELVRREQFRRLCLAGVFENTVLLSADAPGTVERIYKREELENEIREYRAVVRGGAPCRS